MLELLRGKQWEVDLIFELCAEQCDLQLEFGNNGLLQDQQKNSLKLLLLRRLELKVKEK